MLPSDSGNRSSKKYSTFLGVDPGTLTIQKIKRKGARDKKAADKRAPIVNQGIKDQNRKLYGALAYQGRAEDLYASTGIRGRDSAVIDSVNRFFRPMSQERMNQLRSGYSYNPNGYAFYANQNRGINNWLQSVGSRFNNNDIRYGSQYLGIPQYVRSTLHPEVDPVLLSAQEVGGSISGAQGHLRARMESEVRYDFKAHTVDDATHQKYLEIGKSILDDAELFDELERYDEHPEEFTYDELIALSERLEEYQAYMGSATLPESVADVTNMTHVNQNVLKRDAPLPPWAANDPETRAAWEYYTNYARTSFEAQQEAGNKAIEEYEKAQKNSYKIAGTEEGAVDSLLDAFIADTAAGGDPAKEDNLREYFNSYVLNPLKAGEFKKVAWNRVYSFLDILEVAQRGERAIFASDTALGGRTEFAGQSAFWANVDGYNDDDIHEAQELFLQSGGYALLAKHGSGLVDPKEAALNPDMQLSEEELEAKLDEVFGSHAKVPWRAIMESIENDYFGRSAKEKLIEFRDNVEKNLKKTYTDPSATFNADTGNLLKDIILETVTDPGILFGGFAKNIWKSGVDTASETAVKQGLRSVLYDAVPFYDATLNVPAEDAINSFLQNKQVKALLKDFNNVNGKEILFKNADKLDAEVKLFTGRLLRLLPDGATADDAKRVKEAILNSLTETKHRLNANVLAKSPVFNRALDNKIYKTAYFLDKSIDAVDTALLKTAFPEPFALSKTFKITKSVAAASPLGKLVAARKLRMDNTVREIIKKEGVGIRARTEELLRARDGKLISNAAYNKGIRMLTTEFDDITGSINRTVKDMRRGLISASDAIDDVEHYIDIVTDGEARTIDDLEKWIDNLDVEYRNSYLDALDQLRTTYHDFYDYIDLINAKTNELFLDELKALPDINDYEAVRHIFEKYSGQVDLVYLDPELRTILSPDDVDRLLLESQEALNLGPSNKAFPDALFDVAREKGYGFNVRQLDRDKFNELVAEYPELDSALSKARTKDFWYLRDIKYVSTHDELLYDELYRAIDRAINKLELAVKRKSKDITKITDEHKLIGQQLYALRDAIREVDTIGVTDRSSLSTLHLDILETYRMMTDNPAVRGVIEDYYPNVFTDELLDSIKTMSLSEVPADEQKLLFDVLRLDARMKNIEAFELFDAKLKAIPGLSQAKIYSIESAVLGYREYGRDILDEILKNPSGIKDYLDEVVFHNFGGSRLNMATLNEDMRSLFSSAPTERVSRNKTIIEDLKKPENKHMRDWLEGVLNTSTADPQAYADKQMLAVLLMDPQAIKKYNKLASEGETPIFLHFSSTGLNADADMITGIGYRKWVPVQDPDNITLEELYKIFSDNPSTEFRVRLSTGDLYTKLDHEVLQSIFNSTDTYDVLLERYRRIFGVLEDGKKVTEQEILENFFEMLYKDLQDPVGTGKRLKPYRFVVHDLTSSNGFNGYNMRLLNAKVARYGKDKSMPFFAQYAGGISRKSVRQTINTLQDFRQAIPDNALTDEEFFQVERLLKNLARNKMAVGASGDIVDFEGLEAMLVNISGRLSRFNVSDDTSAIVKTLVKNSTSNPLDISGMTQAISEVEKLDFYAKTFVTTTGVSPYRHSPIVHFSDAEYFAHMNDESRKAFENISQALGLPINFSELDGALGVRMRDGFGNVRLDSSAIGLNPYFQDSMFITFAHELRHHLSRTDNAGASFKTRLRDTLTSYFDSATREFNEYDGVRYHVSLETGELISDEGPIPRSLLALKEYVDWIGLRYSNPKYYSGFSDNYMEEFVAPLYEYFFSNPTAFQNVKNYMINAGYEGTELGQKALTFLDNYHILYRNDDHLKNWSGLIDDQSAISDASFGMLNDCLHVLCSDKDLIREFSDTLMHALSNTEELQAKILSAVNTNPVRSGAGAYGRLLNVKDRVDLTRVNKYFKLTDVDSALINFNNVDDYLNTQLSLPMLRQMDEFASKVSRIRHTDLTYRAAEILEPYGSDLYALFRDFKGLITDSQIGHTQYDFIRYLKKPNTTTELFLTVRELYDSYLSVVSPFEKAVIDDSFMKALYENPLNGANEGVISLLCGDYDSVLYKSGNIKDKYARRFHYIQNDLENELDLARRYRRASYDIRSHIDQREHAAIRLRLHGIESSQDHAVAKAFSELLDTLDYIRPQIRTGRLKNITHSMSARYNNVLQQYRLDRLKVNDEFDLNKLMGELLWNGHNHIAFQTARYTEEEIDSLRAFIQTQISKGHDYLRCEIDDASGKIFIFLDKNKVDIYRDIHGNTEKRWLLHKDTGLRGASYEPPELRSIHRYEPETTEEELLIRCWENIEILSDGRATGTSGRILNDNELEHYYNTLPSFMKDMVAPQNLMHTEGGMRLVYDPGFIYEGETDYLLDMMDTMRFQSEVFNQGTATMAYMFGNGATSKFGVLMNQVPDDVIMEFFKKESDFCVCTLVPSKEYIHGVALKELRMDTPRAIEYARNTENAVILPYDIYNETLQMINIAKNPDSTKAMFNKMLLVMKAFQLCNVGTWVRNWYDATKKAALDMGAEPSNVWTLLMYQGKAMQDMATYRKILKQYHGYVDESSWEIIQRTFRTDMTYQDFEVISNMYRSSEFTWHDKLFKKNPNQLISGTDSGVKGLSLQDIQKAYKQTFGKEDDILTKERFLEIHQHTGAAPTSAEQDAFDDMVRKIDTSLRSNRLRFTPQRAINTMFHPFSISENIVRYAQTQYLRDFGMPDGSISKRIHLTQFGSRRNLNVSNYLEYVIPYSNYLYDNVVYWMRLMEENPRYFKYFEDVYGTMVSSHIEDLLDKGQEFDINRDRMVRTGGVPLGGSGFYLKLNPSFFDFIDNMYGGLTNFTDKLNPLLNVATRYTLSELGYGSSKFFSELDLNMSAEDAAMEASSAMPVINKIYNYYRQYGKAGDYFGDDAGLSTRVLWTVLSPLIGINRNYADFSKDDFLAWQEELERQGKWYDSNRGKIVSLEDKEKYGGIGANAIDMDANGNDAWEDRQAYTLVHFGKIWDANQERDVNAWEYQPGGFNQTFDMVHDPTAWDRLVALYESRGMVFDYNTGHFVRKGTESKGDLNDPNLDWDTKCKLMYEKYGKVWDANRNKFTLEDEVLSGGLNNKGLTRYQRNALRLALFGKVWNEETQQYDVVQDPEVVLLSNLFTVDPAHNLYAQLGIPVLANLSSPIHMNDEGFLVTDDGKYVLINSDTYNQRVFDKFTPSRYGYSRSYNDWKHRSFGYTSKFLNTKKPRKIHVPYTSSPSSYLGVKYEFKGDYSYEFKYNYRYHNPQPGRILRRLITSPMQYPYGGGYGKFSFYAR